MAAGERNGERPDRRQHPAQRHADSLAASGTVTRMNVIHISDLSALPARTSTTKRELECDQLMAVVDDTTMATWLLDD